MACELIQYCQFFNDNLQNMPKTAEYLRAKLCHKDFQLCKRFMLFKQMEGTDIPYDHSPTDVEEVEKVMRSLGELRPES